MSLAVDNRKVAEINHILALVSFSPGYRTGSRGSVSGSKHMSLYGP